VKQDRKGLPARQETQVKTERLDQRGRPDQPVTQDKPERRERPDLWVQLARAERRALLENRGKLDHRVLLVTLEKPERLGLWDRQDLLDLLETLETQALPVPRVLRDLLALPEM